MVRRALANRMSFLTLEALLFPAGLRPPLAFGRLFFPFFGLRRAMWTILLILRNRILDSVDKCLKQLFLPITNLTYRAF